MPSYDEICSGLCDILRPFATEGQDLNADTELVADLGLSSLKIMELLMEIEDRFDVTIPLNVLPDVRSVGDFARQLEKLMPEAS